MLAGHAVLLTPLESTVPMSILISIQRAPLTSLESALTSRSQLTENTAALSLVESALTSISPASPLESTLTKTTGGEGGPSHSGSPHSHVPRSLSTLVLTP